MSEVRVRKLSRLARTALISCCSIVALLLLAGLAGLLIVQSDWLREKVRAAVIERAETATGGRVEIGKVQLNWSGLSANVDGLVIHGTESPGQAPLLAVERVTIGFRILSYFSRDVRLDRLDVTRPRVHLIVDSDGDTNLPRPKMPGKTRTSDAILDLKIARVEVHAGEALVESPGSPPHLIPWSGSGRNLAVVALYDHALDRYSGDVAFAPLHLTLEGYGPLDVDLNATATMERDRVVVSKARLKSAGSEINITDLTIGGFVMPVARASYNVKASVAEVARVLHWFSYGKPLPISGMVNVAGKARYVNPGDFNVSGEFSGSGLAYAGVHGIRLAGNVAVAPARAALTAMRVSGLGGEITGSVETKGYDVYQASGSVRGFDVREIVALGSDRPVPYDGLISGPVTASGSLHDLTRLIDATAQLTVVPATTGPAVHGEISAHYSDSDRKLEMSSSWIELPNTRVDVSGTLGASLLSSNMTVKLESKDLNDLLPVLNGRMPPFSLRNGSASFAGIVSGALEAPRIAGHAVVRNALYDGKLIDSAAGDVTASMTHATAANVSIVYDGITANGGGSIALTNWAASDASAITGDIAVSNVDIVDALSLAGYKDVPVSGAIAVTAQVSGTLGQPAGGADVTVTKGLVYQQPYDSVTAHVQYVNADLQTASGVVVSGPKRVTFDVGFSHAGQPFPEGMLRISASGNSMALNQIALVRQRQPDIEGSAQFKGTAAVRVSRDTKKVLHFDLTSVDGDGSAARIALAGRDLGDSHFTARTQGTTLTASFDSNAAKAVIKGDARVDLVGDDHVTGSLTFSGAGLNATAALIVTEAEAKSITFDGAAEGQVDFSGPLLTPAQMSATATIRQIEVHPLPGTPLATTIPGFSLHNSGPVKISLEKSVIRVDAARFQAPETDMTVSGSADTVNSSPLNLRLQGNVNLAILRNFVPDLAASGTVTVNGTLRGNWSVPDFSGRADIRGGEFHYSDLSNGLTNAIGEIVFSGTRANIQSFTADTGGGKFTGSGFATVDPRTGAVALQFSAKTKDVRLRYPQGVSSVSDSDIQLVRNSQRSSIAGTVVVRRLVFNPQQDAAGMLADLSSGARASVEGDNSLANMNLDIQIQTAPDVALQSKVAESIQADATLRLRGTVASPALLGRVNVSQGEVLFFGNKYAITRGSISFLSPTKIDPILDVDLQTRARGVEVTLTVTGPPSNLGMTYRSDPPLEFSDIVALLATGRTPDDPSVALRGNAPTPSFEQLGASALIGQTLANPVGERLQRFFGVSRIKIDPQLSGVGGNPGARLTVEQQVTPDILFTYITDVSNTSQQLIRVEWAFNPRWSAILQREENGYVGLDFTYKRRFK